LGARAVRACVVLLDESEDEGLVVAELLELDHAHVAARRERPVLVEDVGDAAAHARAEVAAGLPEHDHAAARHVLAAVIADPLDDGDASAVAHGEALTGAAGEE